LRARELRKRENVAVYFATHTHRNAYHTTTENSAALKIAHTPTGDLGL
jgi:hypothetical protein